MIHNFLQDKMHHDKKIDIGTSPVILFQLKSFKPITSITQA